jgi:hypothetical protein
MKLLLTLIAFPFFCFSQTSIQYYVDDKLTIDISDCQFEVKVKNKSYNLKSQNLLTTLKPLDSLKIIGSFEGVEFESSNTIYPKRLKDTLTVKCYKNIDPIKFEISVRDLELTFHKIEITSSSGQCTYIISNGIRTNSCREN